MTFSYKISNSMKNFFIIGILFHFYLSAFANQALKIEYRLEAKIGGEKFEWANQVSKKSSAKPKNLESEAFLSNLDFSSFKIKPIKNSPNKFNSFEVELIHSENGRKKYADVANKDRERIYCVVIGIEIYQCSGFTPAVKDLWDKSTSVYGPFSKDQAEKLISALQGNYDSVK